MDFQTAIQYPLGDIIRGYRALEAALKEYEKQISAQLEPHRAQLEIYAQAVKHMLVESKQQSTGTPFGSAYLSEAESILVDNWEDFHAFVEEQQDPDFLIKGAAKKKCQDWRDLHKTLPPGLKSTKVLNVNIRS